MVGKFIPPLLIAAGSLFGILTASASDPQPAEQRIRAALAKPITVGYAETPLTAVVKDLQGKLLVSVQLDQRALNELAVSVDSPITFSATEISAKSALNLMLRDWGLTWTIENEVLMITSPQDAESPDRLLTRLYDVADLVTPEDDPRKPPNFGPLIELITGMVKSHTWDEVGGPGVIQPFHARGIRALVVTHTGPVQEDLAELLANLRALRDANKINLPLDSAGEPDDASAAEPLPPPALTRGLTPAEEKIRQLLKQPIGVHFLETPLSETLDVLHTQTGIKIQIDKKSLNELGISLSLPVTLDMKTLELRKALDSMLDAQGLTWVIQNDCLLVISASQASSADYFNTLVYDVSDLVASHDAYGNSAADYEQLIDLIARTIRPMEWDVYGGEGSMKPFTQGGIQALAIRHNCEVHERIEELLARLRRLRKERPENKQEDN
ncbi:MAG: hypothetical protein JXB10_08985 [Pirellulales bacterium]|nr:hypothetical protein [Pirellulales bacterium]